MAERVGRQGGVMGVDISSTILTVAKERSGYLANLQFAVGDAQTMDLGERVFDLIYSRFGVMFFQNVGVAFTNLHRALKPTARLVLLCWRTREDNPCIERPMAAITEIFPPPSNAGAAGPAQVSLGHVRAFLADQPLATR